MRYLQQIRKKVNKTRQITTLNKDCQTINEDILKLQCLKLDNTRMAGERKFSRDQMPEKIFIIWSFFMLKLVNHEHDELY